MTDHVLAYKYGNESFPVVNRNRQSYHFRNYDRPPGPGFDNLALFHLIGYRIHLLEKFGIDKGTFF